MRDAGRANGVLQTDQICKNLGASTRSGVVDRSVLKRLQSVHAILGRLDGYVVVDPVFGIKPEAWSRLETGTEGDENVLGDVARLQADVLGASAVDIEVKRGVVESLLDVNVHRAGNMAHLGSNFLRENIVGRQRGGGAGDGDVNRSRSAEVQNLRDDVRRLEIELHARILLRELLAQKLDVFGGIFGMFRF